MRTIKNLGGLEYTTNYLIRNSNLFEVKGFIKVYTIYDVEREVGKATSRLIKAIKEWESREQMYKFIEDLYPKIKKAKNGRSI